jgi:hypothetical protein
LTPLNIYVFQGALMLPKTFVSDFGASLGDYATFIDPNNNQFEVMVESICGNVFFLILSICLYDVILNHAVQGYVQFC